MRFIVHIDVFRYIWLFSLATTLQQEYCAFMIAPLYHSEISLSELPFHFPVCSIRSMFFEKVRSVPCHSGDPDSPFSWQLLRQRHQTGREDGFHGFVEIPSLRD
jgi:hypothetical protein